MADETAKPDIDDAGIYMQSCEATGGSYIGMAKCLSQRLETHHGNIRRRHGC